MQQLRPQPQSTINLWGPRDVEYWMKVLGVSRAEIQEAIRKVGNSEEVVRRFLGR